MEAELQGIGLIGITSADGKIKLENTAKGTARLLIFFDELFDSVNGHTLFPEVGKKLKCAVRDKSGHVQFWPKARQHLRNIRFKKANGNLVRPPSLVNWEVSLNGLEHLKKHLKENFNIAFFRPHDINQDPIENFFGQIRQHGGRNVKPSVQILSNFFLKHNIKNMVNTHSVSANCEDDTGSTQTIIDRVQHLVTQGVEEEDDIENIDISYFNDVEFIERDFLFIDKAAIGHVSGYIIKKVKTLNHCAICNYNFISKNKIADWHDISQAKEYNNEISDKLKYCTPKLILGLADIHNKIVM